MTINARSHVLVPLRADRGDPLQDTPQAIAAIGIGAIMAGKTHYADPRGTPDLRQAIADALQGELAWQYDQETEILVSAGATAAIFTIFMSLTSRGDVVLLPDPGWPTYGHMLHELGVECTRYPLPGGSGDSLAVWVAAVKRSMNDRVRIIVLNTPNNPTGAMIDAAHLAALSELLAEWPEVVVLSDDAYCHIVYDRARYASPISQRELAERTIVVRTFSKSHRMAGWRIGYIACPRRLIAPIRKAHFTMNCCASSIAQEAAAWALRYGNHLVDAATKEYEVLRNVVTAELNRIDGVCCDLPPAGLYVFPDVSALRESSQAIADALARQQQVFVYAGSLYGSAGEGHLRVCFASSVEQLVELTQRLRAFVGNGEFSR